MASTFLTRLRALPWIGSVFIGLVGEKIKGQDRKQLALDYVRQNATEGDPVSVLDALDDYGRNERFLMNVGDEKGPLVIEKLKATGDAPRVLELGLFCGYSTVLMAKELADGGKIVTVEIDPSSTKIAGQIIDFAGLSDKVEIVLGDSEKIIPTLDGPFDFVFIDHIKPHYLRDLQLIESNGLLREGSVVFADNVGPFFGADKYLDYVRTSGRYETAYFESHIEYQDIEDGVEVSTFLG